MRVARFLPRSEANAPGPHSVVWFQGCAARCPGCINADLQPFEGGVEMSPFQILDAMPPGVRGLVLTGGEPLNQVGWELSCLIREAKRLGYGVVLFTGWDLSLVPDSIRFGVDVVIAGPYVREQHDGVGMRASRNQHIVLNGTRYSFTEIERVPPVEVHFDLDSAATVTTGVG